MREVDSKSSDRIREMDRGMVGLDPERRWILTATG